jgi:myo-inositol 2-dehydrogenase/D-chiro-inositol 1-dehydrogenase
VHARKEGLTMPKEQPIRFGVIGAGRIGRIHAKNLATHVPGAAVAAIADPRVDAARETAAALNVPVATADYREILADPSIQAVAICSSTNTHTQMIVEASQAGKHIFCEKPIAYDLALIDRALRAAELAGVKLQIGFNRRFDPNVRKIRETVAAGGIGQPHILRITSRDPAPPPIEYVKVSGGIFFDMTIHDFDTSRFLLGEVEEVYTAGAVLVDPEIGRAGDIDTAVVSLKFANGAIGTIDNSRRAVYGYDQRVEVFGSAGMIQDANNTAENTVYANADGVHTARPLYFFLERYMTSFIVEMQDFVACIQNDTVPPVTGADGRAPVVIAMAATKSYCEHRPVKIAEIQG